MNQKFHSVKMEISKTSTRNTIYKITIMSKKIVLDNKDIFFHIHWLVIFAKID